MYINKNIEDNMKIFIVYLKMFCEVVSYSVSSKYTTIKLKNKTVKLLNKNWYNKPLEDIKRRVIDD